MKIKAHCTNPNVMDIQMTFTATLYEWQQIADHLQKSPYYGPVSDIKDAINSVVATISQTFEGDGSLIKD